MFKNSTDIAIIHGAFLSLMQHLNSSSENEISKGLFKLSKLDREYIASVVSNAVELSLGFNFSKWTADDKELTEERLHAVVFYTALKSTGVTSEDADTYYLSVMDLLPHIDWDVYAALVKACHWSKHLHNVLMQLPETVALSIAHNILSVTVEGEANDYLLKYPILQAALFKILCANGVSVTFKYSCPFNFDFVLENEVTKNGSCISNIFYKNQTEFSELRPRETASFDEFMESFLNIENNSCNEIGTLKLILHGLLISLDNVHLTERDKIMPVLISLKAFFHFSENFLHSVTFWGLLECKSMHFFSSELNDFFKNISWDTDIGFLMSLICSGWKIFLSMNASDNHHSLLDQIGRIVSSLESFLEYRMERCPPTSEKCARTLTFVINKKLYGWERCIDTLLFKEDLLKIKDVAYCLVHEVSTLASSKHYMIQLLDVMMKKPVLRMQLSPVIFESLKKAEMPLQLEILQYFLHTYGASSALKREDISLRLALILNLTDADLKSSKTTSQILQLCLESPKDVIDNVLTANVIGNIGQEELLVKVLKYISCVCTFRTSLDQPQLLVNALKDLFNLAYPSEEHRNKFKELLIQLFQAIDDVFCICTCDVLTQCILPNFIFEKEAIVMNFSLESVKIIFESCLKIKNTSWLKKLNVPAFITCMCQVVDFCISNAHGSMKQMALSVINLFSQLLDLLSEGRQYDQGSEALTLWFKKHLSTMNPLVYFYAQKVIAKCTSSQFNLELLPTLTLPQLWTYSCILKKMPIHLINEKFNNSQSEIVSLQMELLCQVLPHFTVEEWIHSYVLLEECLKSQYESFSSSSSPRIDILTRILVDAILLLKKHENIKFEWLYIMNCLSQVVGTQVQIHGGELSSMVIISVCFELLRVAQSVSEDHLGYLTAALFDISEMFMRSLQDEKDSDAFLREVSSIVCASPKNSARDALLVCLRKRVS